jgi:hypothetical protein
MTDITWETTTIKLSQLTPWADNPKTSTGKQQAHLTNSFDELGQFQTVAISPDGDVYDGHQRLSALLAKHGGDYEVIAMQSNRPLTEQERRKIAIYSRQIGAWDWDVLSSWEPAELIDWGFDADTLGDWGRDYSNLREMLGVEISLPDDDEWGAGFDGVPDGERAPFQQMTFTLHDSQVEMVKEATAIAKHMGDFDSDNENSNGNALARICETFITDYGNG